MTIVQNDITFRSDFDVVAVNVAGSDDSICSAAQVAAPSPAPLDKKEATTIITEHLRKKNGRVFEHTLMTVRIAAPVFVWRDFDFSLLGGSYTEQTDRYTELEPVFYLPSKGRPLVERGKSGGALELVGGSEYQFGLLGQEFVYAYRVAWESYQKLLQNDVMKEVARMCLPTSIYSSVYVTFNVRNLMNFLSLNTVSNHSVFKAQPQWELNQITKSLESLFKRNFPVTYESWNNYGRIAP